MRRLFNLFGLAVLFVLISLSFAYPQAATEELVITTYYPSPNGSYRELRAQRMAIGDNYYDSSVATGYCWTAGCANTIEATADLIVQGRVGIGTFTPATMLHVNGATPQLRISGDVGNTGGSFGIYEIGTRSWLFDNPSGANSNLNIYDWDDLQANLRNDNSAQNDDGWVTAAVDYGEYMEKLDHSEDIKPFEVVGVKQGKITKNTNEATLYMITSSNSGIRGGNPIDAPRENDARYIVVAYAGQVPVLVEGSVKEGDYLLPSGKNNGKAVAVSSALIDFETYKKAIGIVLNIVDEDFYKDFNLKESDGGWEKELRNILERKGEYAIVNVAVGVK